jgi:hypothetical protein
LIKKATFFVSYQVELCRENFPCEPEGEEGEDLRGGRRRRTGEAVTPNDPEIKKRNVNYFNCFLLTFDIILISVKAILMFVSN